MIVPLFAFANAGIAIDAGLGGRGSPVTLGILFGYLIGKPVGILGVSLLVTRLSRGRLRPPVGWAAVLGAGTVAGVGFTISLLVATLAFDGARLEEAKVGILAAAGAPRPSPGWCSAPPRCYLRRRIAALLGGEEPLVDLAYDVDPDRDHVRGPLDAPVTVVEYGDFECPYCGRAEPAVRELLRDFADVGTSGGTCLGRRAPQRPARRRGLGGRRRPGRVLADARPAVRASGRAGPADLVGYADQLGLDVERFKDHLREHTGAHRVAEDVEGADLSGVSGTPTFFINGRRHYGAYDLAALSAAVRARRRAGGRQPGGRASPDRQTRPRPHRNQANGSICAAPGTDSTGEPPPPGRRLQRVPSWSLSHDPSATTRPPGEDAGSRPPLAPASGGDRGGGAKRAPRPGRRRVPDR